MVDMIYKGRRWTGTSASIVVLVFLVQTILITFIPQNAAAAGSWVADTPLTNADTGNAVAYQGTIYMLGKYLQTFDKVTDSWTVKGTTPNTYQPYRGGTVIIGDRIYTIHGWGGAYYYDIGEDKYVEFHGPSQRLDVAVGELDGIIYVSGGWYSGNTTALTVVQAYNPANGTWWKVAPMHVGRMDHEMVGLGGYVYALGGDTGSGWGNVTATVERYDPVANNWTLVSPMRSRMRDFAVTAHRGTIVVYDMESEVYFPEHDQWYQGPSVTVNPSYMDPALASLGSSVYAIGGRQPSEEPYDYVFREDDLPSAGDPPSEPLDLKATGGEMLIDLAWGPPQVTNGTLILGYTIYRGDTPTSLSLYADTGNVTTYRDTHVTAGTTYYYQVSAKNKFGEGPMSNVANATPYGRKSGPPIDLIAKGYDGSVQTDWKVPSDNGSSAIQYYNIYRGLNSTNLTYLNRSSKLEYLDKDVSNGVTYYYKVSAVNNDGEGPSSNIANATPYGSPPGPPIDLFANGYDGYVQTDWTAPSDPGTSAILYYKIYRGLNATSLNYLNQSSSLDYIDRAVQNNVTYFYKVSAVNKNGEGPASNIANATPYAGRPGPPLDLAAKGYDGYVQTDWTLPSTNGSSPILYYRIYRGLNATSLTYLNKSLKPEYLDRDVHNGMTYYYKVSAVSKNGEGPRSNIASATPRAVTRPPVHLTYDTAVAAFPWVVIIMMIVVTCSTIAYRYRKERASPPDGPF